MPEVITKSSEAPMQDSIAIESQNYINSSWSDANVNGGETKTYGDLEISFSPDKSGTGMYQISGVISSYLETGGTHYCEPPHGTPLLSDDDWLGQHIARVEAKHNGNIISLTDLDLMVLWGTDDNDCVDYNGRERKPFNLGAGIDYTSGGTENITFHLTALENIECYGSNHFEIYLEHATASLTRFEV